MKRLCPFLFASIILSSISATSLRAAKLVEVKILDEQYLIVHLRDGEVFFRDDGTGESAFTGHSFAEGDDWLEWYGQKLDTLAAADPGAWTLISWDDPQVGGGIHPEAVHRRSKVWHSTHDWQWARDHWIFLRLPRPMKQGMSYRLNISPRTNADDLSAEFTFNIYKHLSEAIHVNMIGYLPGSPVKSADLYLWMGDGGQRDYSGFEGNDVLVLDVESGEEYKAGEVNFWKRNDTDAEARRRNLTGSDVWNIDLSGFSTPGTYRLVVEGVGCSREFEISDEAYYEPYRYSVRGYYYMRVGEDRMDMVPVPRRPPFIPGRDPEGFVVYMTSMHPFRKEWEEHPGDTWDEPHFRPAKESMFWKSRLPGNPVNPDAFGGHSDALDWDRHLAHVSNIYDLLLPYIMTGGALDEDDLGIGESGNGIPDIIDEARNEVDMFLRLRDEQGGYAQGLTNPSQEYDIMFQAGTTTIAAWANAANCAMLAEAFRISGHTELRQYYTEQAIRAYRYAGRQKDQMLKDRQNIGDGSMYGEDFKQMAAAWLYNLTGKKKWEQVMAELSVVSGVDAEIISPGGRGHYQLWGTAAYLYCPRERHFPELYQNMKAAVRSQATRQHVAHMSQRPSRRTSGSYWQTAQNLQLVMLAHGLTADPREKERFMRAMIVEADWGLGRNPSNMVEMTGLGERHVVNCYTSGRNDGTPGLHPGHTPYHNLDHWGGTHNGSHPEWFTQKCYPAWEDGWPHQEGHFNTRYCWANAEFTPRQTMRGKMALYGYLYGIRNGRIITTFAR